jgi:hypothetical protein
MLSPQAVSAHPRAPTRTRTGATETSNTSPFAASERAAVVSRQVRGAYSEYWKYSEFPYASGAPALPR